MPFPSQKFNSLNVWVAAKNEKRTHSATLTKKRYLVNKQKLFLYCCYKDWNHIN